MDKILSVNNLNVSFNTRGTIITAVNNLSFHHINSYVSVRAGGKKNVHPVGRISFFYFSRPLFITNI